jgi:hypothetical protein
VRLLLPRERDALDARVLRHVRFWRGTNTTPTRIARDIFVAARWEFDECPGILSDAAYRCTFNLDKAVNAVRGALRRLEARGDVMPLEGSGRNGRAAVIWWPAAEEDR